MVSNNRSDLTSPFDEMLEENRRQLDHLYGGPAPTPSRALHGGRREASPAVVPSGPAAPRRPAAPKAAPLAAASDDRDTEISRRGRARTAAPGGAASLAGSADGVAFTVGSDRSGETG